MADGGINYRIELDSSEAERSLQELQGAAAGLAGQFEKMAAAVSAGGLGAFTVLATAAASAVVGLTGALFSFAKSSAAAVDELGEMADQMGSTVEEMSTLRAALGQFEANTDTLQRAFNRMGNTIQEQMPAVQKAMREAAGSMAKDMNSVASASLGVAEAEAKLQQTRTGVKTPPGLTQELELKRQIIAVDQARAAQAEATAKAEEARRNDIRELAKYVDALATGFGTAGIKVNVTVDNIIKGLIASVGPGVTALEGLRGGFREISQQSPEVRTALLKLADVFQNLNDGALKTAIATKLFGRKDATDMVEALSVGSAAIREQEARWRSLGLEITTADRAISGKFIAGMNRLGLVIGTVSTQFGLLFQPAFTTFLEGLATALERNRGAIIAWGQSIAAQVGPALESFGRALAGTARAGDQWAADMIASVMRFAQGVQVAFNLVVQTFRGVVTAFEFVATGLNKVFGTALSALDVFLLAVGARIGIAMVALATRLGPVGWALLAVSLGLGAVAADATKASTAVTKAANDTAAAASKSQTAVAAATTTPAPGAWQWLMETLQPIGIWIETKILEGAALFAAWVTTAPANAWGWITETFNSAVTWLGTAMSAAYGQIAAFVTTPVANAWQWIKDMWNAVVGSLGGGAAGGAVGGGGGHAAGGLLGGRGTGTSDSNLAWVSRGEYITPARAVRQPGVLAFLEALRQSGGNLRSVIDNMGRYALGGMVRAPIAIPAFAGGGSMNNVTINFPGLPEITGLRASANVVDELRKAAALSQVRSGGRKPSRYS